MIRATAVVLLACLGVQSCDAIGLHMASLVAPGRFGLHPQGTSSLHGGAWNSRGRTLIAKRDAEINPLSPAEKVRQFLKNKVDVPKVVDTLIAGFGLFATIATMGILEKKIGVKLFVPPMMASGIIFFAPMHTPDPFGFLSGTAAGLTICSFFVTILANRMPAIGAGAAAGALLVWYKSTNSIFPPAAVLSVLMAQSIVAASAAAPAARWASSLKFVATPWLAGHACLYAASQGVSVARQHAGAALSMAALADYPADKVREIFKKYDTSGDGQLDPLELKIALREVTRTDFSLKICEGLVGQYDTTGTGTISFREFQDICKIKR
ncbi:hypothetical protein T484DRAFT_1934743 [Baffinella frigidus]|nr:hypothetical protein T484DRAFT_1934743 [Cryptophyta sp. CCMP2293]|mmetsp:Transcript_8025/g.18490  ORF Transcript_8025/g.18490 Transcript_8025/m.18490 type:complete len:324 (+) Transcript_8025:42-1013(+)